METQKYDIRLLLYQSIAEIPFQVLMLDLFEKMEKRRATYAALALVNLGVSIASLKLGRGVYSLFHDAQIPQNPNDRYYVAPTSQYLYTHNKKQVDSIPKEHREEYLEFLNRVLAQAPAYSKAYLELQFGAFAAKTAFGAGAYLQNSPSPAYALLYGLTQPLSVILKEGGFIS